MKMMMKIVLMLLLALNVVIAEANSEVREINGVNLSILEAGEGPAVIFLHGKNASKEYMSTLFYRFMVKYRVFSYDSRGHGQSSKPEAFTLEDNADDLAGLVDAYGLKKPAVVGFSMGS